MNVLIHGFDDAKVDSNKVAYKVTSTIIQRLSIASRLIQGQANKIKKKIKPQTISLVDQAFASKHIVSNIEGSGNQSPGNVIDYQKTILTINF